MDAIEELGEMEHQQCTTRVAIATATSSSIATSVDVKRSNSTYTRNSSKLTTKTSSNSLASASSKTYCNTNTTASVVTRKRGGLAIAIKRQDSIEAYGNISSNNSACNTPPLGSVQSSYSVPATPPTTSVPTLRRGEPVRVSDASTAICVGNGDNASNTRVTNTQQLSCLERFRGSFLKFFYKIMGSRTPSEADGYDYYDLTAKLNTRRQQLLFRTYTLTLAALLATFPKTF